MSNIKEKLVHEFKSLVPVTVYFLFANELLAVTHRLLLSEYGITVSSFVRAIVLALVIAKVVLLLDHVPLMNVFRNKPRVYNVLWKSAMYFVASLIVQIAEGIIRPWIASGSLQTGVEMFNAETVWVRFYLVQMWMYALLVNYCFVKEIGRELKPGTIFSLLFRGTPSRP